MSDKTEREYRQNMLTILDRFYRGRGGSLLTKDESEAIEYAISSIKTDFKYDLLYEETTHTTDADKKIEPTPNDCETCIHNKSVEEINEKLIKEYISKVRCCDECFASVYCTVNGLRESRVPQEYCVKNIERYFNDKTSPTGAEVRDKE